ncbi:diacylglycerol kinase [Microbacterium sp. P03]|uniref:diacylglycerol kinase n=2 Tax=unclassified Microbacterium TaxID=2609290 RepID=UPI00374706F6
MNVVVLLNPAARGDVHRATSETVARLRAAGHTVSILRGADAAESTALIRASAARSVDAVVVVGGDGIAHLALQELAGTDVPLGIIPVGTGNDLATHLGIPEHDRARAADIVAAGHVRRIDLAETTDLDGTRRLFGTVLASGFDSYVNGRANRMRWPRGPMRYNIAIFIEFLFLKSASYRVEIDDETLAGEFMMVTVANTRTYGGGIPISPDADDADGLLDITIVRAAGRLRLLGLLVRVLRGTHLGRPEVITRRALSVRLDSPGMTAYADGDPIGLLPLTVRARPTVIGIFAPARR